MKYRPQESEFRILMRDNGEDYISMKSGESTSVTLHWEYINEPQMEVIKDLIINLGELAQFFLFGLYEWVPVLPTEKEEGFYRDEFIEKINDIYNPIDTKEFIDLKQSIYENILINKYFEIPKEYEG